MKVICIGGPTATGKTRLSVKLCEELNGEVISCDSMQVYRGMDIGTAKASEVEMRGIVHHMLNVADPNENYSVGKYVRQAACWVDDIVRRGKLPFIVGGTGLYMDSLVRGIDFSGPPGNSDIRAKLEEIAMEQGGNALREILREFDPEAAERIHPNNVKRLIRAIEIYETTGKTVTVHDEESRLQPDAYEAIRIVLSYADRSKLYEKIDRRVDMMMDLGLVNEVKSLIDGDVSPASTSMAAIGYKEVTAYLQGRCSLEESVMEIKKSSRRYAKRQITWFKRHKDTKWIDVDMCSDFNEVVRIAREYICEQM